ncbi:MAG: hypothetical protein EZS28_033351 [Streblomastix strix]|uniref:Uncharacterized protein n=1 Tax=Streblomastix strix TaxID=222440 RepID=A0A5J4UM33_9EUKA|nr:MAG: hypothetical protein EZS28_033351 [Streblomastix strix]
MSEFVTLRRIDWIRFKAVAEDYFLRGYNFEDTYAEMSITYAGICPEKNTLYKWEKSFKSSDTIVQYSLPSGRPRIYGLAGKILPHIMDYRSVSLTMLSNLLGQSREAINFAIENDLKMHQLSQRWILHQLSERNLEQRVEACGELVHFLGAHKIPDIAKFYDNMESAPY